MQRSFIGVLVVVALVQPRAVSAAPATPPMSFGTDATWIESAMLPDGALPETPGSAAISPYLADLATRGLASAAAAGDPSAAAAGWAWCRWFARHQRSDGLITDFVESPGGPRSTGLMDSVDGYAGTYLSAVRDLYAATRDAAEIRDLSSAVDAAARAVESLQDSDGLTWAKPSWHVKYLMDEAEAYDGLLAAAQIDTALGEDGSSRRWARDAARLRTGVSDLWDPIAGAFDWGVTEGGGRHRADWSLLYPDAMQQVWAVAYGLADQGQAAIVMAHFTGTHPSWAIPDGSSRTPSGLAPNGYWPVALWALRAVRADISTPLRSLANGAAALTRTWPFTVAVAGELMVGASPWRSALPGPAAVVVVHSTGARSRATHPPLIARASARRHRTFIPRTARI
jgi:hypothetical protein